MLKAVVPILQTDSGMNVLSFPDEVKHVVFMTCFFGAFSPFKLARVTQADAPVTRFV